MEFRQLGRDGDRVSVIGVGTWAAGGRNWGGTDDEKTADAFRYAADELEINFFDTAPVYGFGHAERVLGEALESRRDSIFLATKFGLEFDEENHDAPVTNNLRPESVRAECEGSLRRLRTEVIDLYQAHWPLPGDAMTRTVCEDMISALESLRTEGKIRFFGVSNFSVEQMEWCGGPKTLTSLQPPLSILRPAASEALVPWCRENGIGVVCYSPLFRGLLTGKYKGTESFPEGDSRAAHPDYKGDQFKGICAAAARLAPLAERHETTIAGISLNWVLSQPGVTVAIAGTRSRDQIAGAARGQGFALSPAEVAEINDIFKDHARDPSKK